MWKKKKLVSSGEEFSEKRRGLDWSWWREVAIPVCPQAQHLWIQPNVDGKYSRKKFQELQKAKVGFAAASDSACCPCWPWLGVRGRWPAPARRTYKGQMISLETILENNKLIYLRQLYIADSLWVVFELIYIQRNVSLLLKSTNWIS